MEDKDKVWQDKMRQYKMPAYNTQQGWEKLQHKLKNKKVKKFYFLKASAAAVLLLAIGFYAGLNFTTKTTIVAGKQIADTHFLTKENKPYTTKNDAEKKINTPAHIVQKPFSHQLKKKKEIATIPIQKRGKIIEPVAEEDKQMQATGYVASTKINATENAEEAKTPVNTAFAITTTKPATLPVITIEEINSRQNAPAPPKEKKNILARYAKGQPTNSQVAYSKFDALKIHL